MNFYEESDGELGRSEFQTQRVFKEKETEDTYYNVLRRNVYDSD